MPDKGTGRQTVFPIIGIGASAGGLEAVSELLEDIPTNINAAFVLIQHLDPSHKSMLSTILSRRTSITVSEVDSGGGGGGNIESGHFYIIPPNANLTISSGRFTLSPRSAETLHRPIDRFLISLAEDQQEKAIGIILSGTSIDGIEGLKSIKAAGGITIAQSPESAKYGDLPRSAIAAGCVDIVLSPKQIGEALERIISQPLSVLTEVKEPIEKMLQEDFERILMLVRSSTHINFTNYKEATLKRRINRRMLLNKIESYADYYKYLKENPAEVQLLSQDLLIYVTSFFREPKAFEILRNIVFPRIMKRPENEPIRIWAAGCAGGEEAYSIAITLNEYLEEIGRNQPVQIFASDLNEKLIEKARSGVYQQKQNITPRLLERYFVKSDGGWKIAKHIREMCVFAKQDISSDPPFLNLDIISCQNVLIYLKPELHARILQKFHYALKPTGYLLLGSSETTTAAKHLFEQVDQIGLYTRKAVAAATRQPLTYLNSISTTSPSKDIGISKPAVKLQIETKLDIRRSIDRLLLSRYAPPGVTLNEDLEVIEFRGETGKFLQPAAGKASFDFLNMLREGLMLDIRDALRVAKKDNVSVRKEGMRVRINNHYLDVNSDVIPVHTDKERHFVVLFEEAKRIRKDRKKIHPKKSRAEEEAEEAGLASKEIEVDNLRKELAATKEHLQSIIEVKDNYEEGLLAANEAMQSSNEELRALNEEMETTKEEVQSTNEELLTLNQEMRDRNEELNNLNNDLNNVLGSTNLPIIIVGNDLHIRRFTSAADKLWNLVQNHSKSLITTVNLGIKAEELDRMVRDVLEKGEVKEQESHLLEGHCYSLRISPYKTEKNEIDGAVLVLVDIDERKQAEEALRKAHDELEIKVLERTGELKDANQALQSEIKERKIADAKILEQATLLDKAQDAVAVRDLENRLTYWNKGAERLYGWTADEVLGKNPDDILYKESFRPAEAEKIVREKGEWRGYLQQVTKDGREITVEGRWTLVRDHKGEPKSILVINTDVTGRKELEERLLRSQRLESLGMLANGIAHDLNNILAPITISLELLQDEVKTDEGQTTLDLLERSAERGASLIKQIQVFARGVEGERNVLQVRNIISEVEQIIKETFPRNIKVKIQEAKNIYSILGDSTQLYQVLVNICLNARDAMMPDGGLLSISAENFYVDENYARLHDDESKVGQYVVITVSDTGTGIPPNIIDKIFDPFFTTKEVGKGTGLGLSTALAVVKSHDGFLAVHSEVGKGSEFKIYLPAVATITTPAPTAEKAAEAETEEDLAGLGATVLIVEDEESIREITRSTLEKYGYKVLTADNGAEAISVYKKNRGKVKVVLMDLMMPSMDGEASIKALRKINRKVKIIAVSGVVEKDRRERTRKMVQALLLKPYTAKKLLKTIHKTLNP
ncbi:MAG: PAS domain S-box protein [Thaumarchaeota archaeon]|nr:PAS domain S-box protein [Nitrososphaerota archaeon]MCL5319094.1 PAS domain S-box protein [Nitrososphaerota archaeon]